MKARKHLSVLKLVTLLALTALTVIVAAGCGGKPAFCEDRTTLEQSVKGLPGAATSGGVSGLQAQVTKVQTDANALIASARSDFPTESKTLEDSINQLETSVTSLPTSATGAPEKPSKTQLAAIGLNVSAVVSSFDAFERATDAECIE